ncbi:pro-opiomelanocortin isoform 2-T2 [Liasis olivaceus]
MLRGRKGERPREGERERRGRTLVAATETVWLSLKMLNPQWSRLLAIMGVLLIHSAAGVHSLCWESSWCWSMDTEVKMMECLRACRMGLSDESPVYPGHDHMQPLPENIQKYIHWNKFGKNNSNGRNLGYKRKDLSSDSSADLFSASSQTQESWEGDSESHQESREKQEGKRSYAMEHFRWGKPVGRKRRPIKVNPNGVEEESSESYPQEFRRDLSWEMEYPELNSPEEKQSSEATMLDKEMQPRKIKKDNAAYKMHHFRWNTPALPKKKRYGGFMTSEHSHTPLVTLFKNAIIKTAYKKGQ